MILHTLNASPASAAFAECLRLLAPGDALLLLGDGVYCALAGTTARAQLDAAGAELYVLHDDVAAAGILGQTAGTSTVDIDGFVALTERFARQLAWY
jgi:tRNA 2-thiouridine synthesizing protein B